MRKPLGALRIALSSTRRMPLESGVSNGVFSAARLEEIVRLAERSPDDTANVAELAVIKTGSFAQSASQPKEDRVRVVVWNMERGRALDEWLGIDAIRQADLLILCEVDDGMARSGNLNVPEEMAKRLGMHYAFVPNYFEFTRGTRRERRATRGMENRLGLHGNAIVSRWPLSELRRVPLPIKFDWFKDYERRIGTRVGLVATVELPGGPLTVVSAHLEAFATPAERAEQMRVLLRAIPERPERAIIGGDFNTLGIRPTWREGLRLCAQRFRTKERPIESIVGLEPLFEEVRRSGFSWDCANADAATWRFPHFAPAFHAKLDWAFVRAIDVVPASLAVVRAVSNGSGTSKRLSDHDGLRLTIGCA